MLVMKSKKRVDFKIDTKDLELIERQSKAALDAKLIESELAKKKTKASKKARQR